MYCMLVQWEWFQWESSGDGGGRILVAICRTCAEVEIPFN